MAAPVLDVAGSMAIGADTNFDLYYPGTKVVHMDLCTVLDFKLCNLVEP